MAASGNPSLHLLLVPLDFGQVAIFNARSQMLLSDGIPGTCKNRVRFPLRFPFRKDIAVRLSGFLITTRNRTNKSRNEKNPRFTRKNAGFLGFRVSGR